MSLRRSLVLSVSGRIVAVALQLLSSLVIARLLVPAEFGLFSIAAAAITISASLREFGVTSYLIRLDTIDPHSLGRALAFSLTISLTAGAIIFLARHAISGYYRDPVLADLIAILCLNFILVPPTIPAVARLHRAMRFGAVNAINIISLLVAFAVSLTLAARGHGPASLAIGQVTQTATSLACLIVLDWRTVLARPVFTGMGPMIRFGAFSALSSLVYQAGTFATPLVLGRLLGPAAVGFFDRGNGLFVSIANDVVGTIGNVLFVGLAKVRTDSAELARLLHEALRNLTAIAWPGFMLIAALADPLMVLMFGERWRPAVGVLQILCVAGLAGSGSVLYFQTITAMGATARLFRNELIAQTTRLLAIIALAGFGIHGAAIATVIGSTLLLALHLTTARRYVHARRRDVVMIFAESAALAALTATAPALLVARNPLALPPFPLLALAGSLGAATWLAAIFLLRHPIAHELRRAAGLARS